MKLSVISHSKKQKVIIKLNKIIDSCKNIYQINTAHNCVNNFGKLYQYDKDWSKLDEKVSKKLINTIDELEYKKRLNGI